MYIVSPNCDLRRLPQAATQWARQFPLSPTLPNFLSELSVAPRPYKLHCPSKAHRPVYMAMLAWLMRGGWVTQLCTFAYVVVWPEIIYEVEHALEAEDIARAKHAHDMAREAGSVESDDAATTASTVPATPGVAGLGDAAVAGFASNFLPLLYDTSDLPSTTTSSFRDLPLSHSQSSIIPSNSNSAPTSPMPIRNNYNYPLSTPPPPPSPQTPHSNMTNHEETNNPTTTNNPNHSNEPTPAEQAAEKARLARIADRAARVLAERATAHARKQPPQQTAHPSVNHARHLEGMTPHVILDAKQATGKESLYLSAIGRRFRDRVVRKHDKGGVAVGSGDGERERERERDKGRDGGGGQDPNSKKGREGSAGGAASGGGGSSSSVGGGGGPTAAAAAAAATVGIAAGGARLGVPQATSGAIRDAEDWDERVANAWPVFCKYFNGRSALERIALQEDMKRKDVWNLLTAMSEYLLCVRHW